MANTVKYTFDQAFDGGAKSRYEQDVARLEQQIATTATNEYARGLEDGRQEVRAGLETEMRDLFATFLHEAKRLMDDHSRLAASMEADMVQLSYEIAGRLAPVVREIVPLADLQALLQEAVQGLSPDAKLELRVAPQFADAAAEQAQMVVAESGLSSNIDIIADQGLTGTACRLSWREGQIAFSAEKVQQELDGLISQYRDRLLDVAGTQSRGDN